MPTSIIKWGNQMASVRVSWQTVSTSFPEGTSPLSHYVAFVGSVASPNLPPGTLSHTFADVSPGDFATGVDSVAMDGSVLATNSGPVVHVPQPVMVNIASSVTAEVLPDARRR